MEYAQLDGIFFHKNGLVLLVSLASLEEYLVKRAILFAKIKLNEEKRRKIANFLHYFNFFCSAY